MKLHTELLVLAAHLKQIKTIFFNVNVDSVTSFVPSSKGPSCAIRVNRVVEISKLYNELKMASGETIC